jgi:hypothetical protein
MAALDDDSAPSTPIISKSKSSSSHHGHSRKKPSGKAKSQAAYAEHPSLDAFYVPDQDPLSQAPLYELNQDASGYVIWYPPSEQDAADEITPMVAEHQKMVAEHQKMVAEHQKIIQITEHQRMITEHQRMIAEYQQMNTKEYLNSLARQEWPHAMDFNPSNLRLGHGETKETSIMPAHAWSQETLAPPKNTAPRHFTISQRLVR